MDINTIKELSDKELVKLAKKYIDRMIIYPTKENKEVYDLILKEIKERNIITIKEGGFNGK
jgi:hypothetical protein